MSDSTGLLWLSAMLLMGSPGPATLSLAGAGSAFGFRSALFYLCGIVTGTFAVLLVVATGVVGMLSAAPTIGYAVSVLALGYMLYLAWQIATAPVAGDRTRRRPGSPRFIAGLALAVSNPKAYAAIGAVYSGQVIYPDAPLLDAVTKVIHLGAAIALIATVWLALGAALAGVVEHPVRGRIVNVAFAVALMGAVLASL